MLWLGVTRPSEPPVPLRGLKLVRAVFFSRYVQICNGIWVAMHFAKQIGCCCSAFFVRYGVSHVPVTETQHSTIRKGGTPAYRNLGLLPTRYQVFINTLPSTGVVCAIFAVVVAKKYRSMILGNATLGPYISQLYRETYFQPGFYFVLLSPPTKPKQVFP